MCVFRLQTKKNTKINKFSSLTSMSQSNHKKFFEEKKFHATK